MGLSLVACGEEATTVADNTEATTVADTEADTTAPDDDTEATVDDAAADGIEAPSTDGWDDSKKINIYDWDGNFKKTVELLLADYPQYKDYINWIVVNKGGQDEEWKQAVESGFEDPEKYPSIVPADIGVIKMWSEDKDKTANLYDLGFTDDMFANNYDFVLDFGVTDGSLNTVCYQANPGSFFYRRDIAKDVFGTDDPEKIQEEVKDWDTFNAAAAKLKEKGYFIVSGPNDVQYPIWETKSNAWVDEDAGALKLDDSVTQYLEEAKILSDEGYTNGVAGMWNNDWYADMTDNSKVFGFFGCPWFIGTMTGNGATEGSWATCAGPSGFHWGGTYVAIGKDTPNPELASWICYMICCDTDFNVKLVNSECDTNCSANKAANERLLAGELDEANYAPVKFFGGQNPLPVWVENAPGINLAYETYADGSIQGYMNEASTAYNKGEAKDIDAALQYIKDKAASELNLTAE
jgi:hypothetical protein